MRHAILSEIHANLDALHAVLEDLRIQGCLHVACLGDIVGHGANPKECFDLIRGMAIPVVLGNHDEYAAAETHLPASAMRTSSELRGPGPNSRRRTATGCVAYLWCFRSRILPWSAGFDPLAKTTAPGSPPS